MRATRRDVLRSGTLASLLPLASWAQAAPVGSAQALMLVDSRLPGCTALAGEARRAGLRVADTGGEIIHRLLEADISAAPLLGYTAYVDYALARDALRLRRSSWGVLVLNGTEARVLAGGNAKQETLLLALAQRVPRSATTRYIWVA